MTLHPRVLARRCAGAAAVVAVLLGTAAGAHAQTAPAKRPLDHDAYDRWTRIQSQGLSADGAWLRYVLTPGEGDGALVVRSLTGPTEHRIERGTAPQFTEDSRFVVFRISPAEDEVEAAEEAGRRGARAPQDSLGILDLRTGAVTRVERVRAFQLPEESSEWVAYHRPASPEQDEDEEEEQEEEPGAAAQATNEALEERREDKTRGTELVLRNLRTGAETAFASVVSFDFTDDGSSLVYAAQGADGAADGVYRVATGGGQATALLTGEGEYERLTLDEEGERLAFLTNRDFWTSEDETLGRTLYLAELDGGEARAVAREGAAGIPGGWWVSEHGSVAFSEDGERVFFGTAPRPAPEPEEGEDELLDNVVVDIWNWKDPYLMTQQLVEVDDELERTWDAVYFVDDARIVQLEDPSMPSVDVADERNARVALGEDDGPYRQVVSWDTRFADLYLIDVESGERELLAEEIRGGGSISPDGRYVYWWDGGWSGTDLPRGWMVLDLETREVVNATAAIPVPVYDELDDHTAPVGSHGLGGWTADDRYMVVNDRYDLWLVDPRGREAPRNLTGGFGRANGLELRIDRLGWPEEQDAVPLDREIWLTAFDTRTKDDGFYRARLDRGAAPTRVVMEPVSFGGVQKAEDADVLLFTKSTFQDFPDVWVSDAAFAGQRKMSEANPQQAEYRWGTAELVEWTSADGEPLQGILYKPEGFDASREYPMMVFFYERYSDGLHGYFAPSPGTSINRSFYVSRGYLLFVPDIPYKAGYPGESAMNAVVPGIHALVEKGYVDRGRIGVQGHSWGGYQIAYMVTRSNIFAAAEAGAPVANMTSAYGGIRYESGRVRAMQYETGQSRIGGTLWNAQHRYIENSPLFAADRIQTPLLMLHNDNDGAVPWTEGVQLFSALRRLGKPTWLVNYNGQGHGVSGEYRQKDWAIRMQQFFDHYLMDAPAPVWMIEGVPATMKGKTLGLDLVETEDRPATTMSGGGGGGGGR